MKQSLMPILATLAYMLVGMGWIIGGSALSAMLHPGDPSQALELYKGSAFVVLTAGILFVLLRYQLKTPGAQTTSFGEVAAEFKEAVSIGERTLRWLPRGLVFLSIVLLACVLLSLYWVRDSTITTAERSTDELRHSIASQVGTSIKIIDLTLADIAHDLANNKLDGGSAELRRFLTQSGHLARAIWVLNADGKRILDSDDSVKLGVDLSSREYFLHHRDSGQRGFFLGSPLRSVTNGNWFVSASHAVRSAKGDFLGVVVAALDVQQFGRLWRGPLLADDGNVTLFRNDGTLLMRSPYAEHAIGKSYKESYAWRELVPQRESAIYHRRSAVDGISRIFSFGPVPLYNDLVVFVGLPDAPMLAQWRLLAAVSIGAYLLFAGLLATFAFIFMNQTRLRIAAQRKASELARFPLQNPNPVISVDRSGPIRFMNDAARQLFDAVANTPDGRQLDEALLDIAKEAHPGMIEVRVGNRLFAASYATHAEYCDIYLADVSQTRDFERKLGLFFELPFIGMAITSPESKRWVNFNDELCNILGYSRRELAEKTWADMTHPDDLAADVAQFEQVMSGESDGYTMEKRFVRADGSTVYATIDVKAIRRIDRSIEFFLATIEDITLRKQRERELQQQRNLYAALSATNKIIIRTHERQQLMAEVCRVAVQRTEIVFAWLGLVEESTARILPAASFGDERDYAVRITVSADPDLPEGRGPAGTAVRENRHVISKDVANDPAMSPWRNDLNEIGVRACASFPIRRRDKVIGCMNFYAKDGNLFTEETVSLLDEMSDDISYALNNLEREQERAAAVAELSLAEERWQFALEGGEHGVWEWNTQTGKVYFSRQWKSMLGYADDDLSDSLEEWSSRVHPEDLSATMEAIQRHFRGETTIYISEHRLRCKDGSYKWILDRGKVMTRDAEGKPLTVVGTHTDLTEIRAAELRQRESEAKFRGLVEQTLVGIYIIDDVTMYYANPRTAEIFGYHMDEILGPKMQKLVHPEDWPLVQGNIRKRLRGEVNSMSYEFRGRRRDGTDVNIGVHGSRGEYAGRPVIIGVLQDITERLRTSRQLDEYVARLEKSIEATTRAISEMVEIRDPYTAGHERRVAEIAVAIGGELGMSEHDLAGLKIMGHVHDVGKIVAPAEILSKPGRLSAAEYEIVKAHAEKGYEILKSIDFPWPVAEAVRQHHERMDGSGYPRGLKGEQIMLAARILAVADVVESMASHRPYRPALGPAQALAEIEKNAGRLYDTGVAAACLRLFRDKNYQLPD